MRVEVFLYILVMAAVTYFIRILTATGSAISAALGFAAALILAFRGKSLLTVAIIASATVLVCELILPYLPL